MLKIAFCDDETQETRRLEALLEEYAADRGQDFAHTSYQSPVELMAEVEKGTRFDIILLDVLMPGENGMAAAREIREYDSNVKIIFLTSSTEFAVESYAVDAWYYQLKPIRREDFFRLMDSACAACTREQKHSLILRSKSGIVRLELEELVYCEVMGRTLTFHLNNGVVLESDVDGLMQSVKLNAGQAGQQLPDDATLRHQILERLIMDQIVLQMGQKMGVKVSDDQLDQAIANIAKQNNMTMDQMRSRLAYDGLNYNTYRNQIRKEMLIAEVRNNEVRRRVTILPQEVDALAKQVGNQNDASTELNLSHILIPLPENPTSDQAAEAESQARSIVDQARKGGDFGKLAITYSADQQALKGGQMGWGRIQELPSIFAQALSTAKKGDIVGPIRSGVGFHILKVNDLRGQSQSISVTEVHARHILMKPSPIMTDDQARAKLEQIAADIKSGKTSFANAAKEFSQDPGSANQGGDLGWAAADIYDPAFRDALMKLNKGQMSAPVHSSFGWHLIELMDARNVDKTDAAQKDRAYRMLFNRKFSEEAATWMQEQRASAYVKVLSN